MGVFRKDIVANVSDCSTTLDSPLVIYYKDRGLELYFNLVQYRYKFQQAPNNILKNLDGAYASITIVNPSGYMRRYEDIPIERDKIKFVITQDLTDDLDEIGIYQMQIHINNDVDGKDTSVFSIPPFEFEVKPRLVGRIDTDSSLVDNEGNTLVDAEGYTLNSLDNNGTVKIINFNTAKINAILTKADTLDTTNLATTTQLDTKVDKVDGYSLVANTEIARLSNVNNYDDTAIRNTLNSKANKTDLHTHSNKSVLDGITADKVNEWNNKSTFNGNYDKLTNKPTIPVVDSSLSTTSANAIQNKAVANALNNKANSSHNHTIANITNLQNTLDNKANANHTHSYNDLTDKPTIPSIDGLATETFVTNKIAEAQLGGGSGSSVDLSGYAQLTGATFTGRITSPEVSATNYFVTPSLVGEGDNTSYYHRVDFGHKGFDHCDFYEYGGIYNFYKNTNAGKGGAELLFGITPTRVTSKKDLYEGDVRVYSPNNKPTASDLGITVTNGQDGEDGATFTPSVDSNGNLSWTNNKGLTNPTTVNIKGGKGDKGDKGDTGANGVTPTLKIGTTSTLASGNNATVNMTQSGNTYTLNFGIPKGADGAGGGNTKTLTTISMVGSSLNLTTNEYQYCNNITDGTEIVLPTTSSFTEIHLFIKPTSAISLVLPSAKYQNSPNIEANKVYEFIFTYVNSTIGWLGGVVVYS